MRVLFVTPQAGSWATHGHHVAANQMHAHWAAYAREKGTIEPEVLDCKALEIPLEKMIENDAITSEMYADRLDSILKVGLEEGESALTPGSQQVLDVWDQMDTGLIKNAGEAFDEADRRVRLVSRPS